MNLSKYVKKPLLTEKSFDFASQGRYIFEVELKATKNAIRKDIKKLYEVDAIEVKTNVMPGKKRRIFKTKRFIKTPKWKKAIVFLKQGQKIDIFPKEEKAK